MQELMCSNNDDQESVTQRTVVGIGGVLKTPEDYVVHAATLRTYSGDRLKKANVRYPADAQRAFNKYAGALMVHYDRNLSHAKALHAFIATPTCGSTKTDSRWSRISMCIPPLGAG